MRCGQRCWRPRKMLSTTPTGPTACPGARVSRTWRNWRRRSANNSLPTSSRPPCAARPSGRLRPASVRAPVVPSRSRPSRPNPANSTPTPAPSCGTSRRLTAPSAAGLFFPQSKSLGLDRSGHSPALKKKVVYAGSNSASFQDAVRFLKHLAGHDLDPKVGERATRCIGAERLTQRQTLVDSWEELTLAQRDLSPTGVVPELAVVMTDGGRLQIRPQAVADADAD